MFFFVHRTGIARGSCIGGLLYATYARMNKVLWLMNKSQYFTEKRIRLRG